ncbi:MAG: hypothetical protein ABI947_21470 [Chloroflexota bacterium]
MKQYRTFLLTVCLLVLLVLVTPVYAQGTNVAPANHPDVYDFILIAMGFAGVGLVSLTLFSRSNFNRDEDE